MYRSYSSGVECLKTSASAMAVIITHATRTWTMVRAMVRWEIAY